MELASAVIGGGSMRILCSPIVRKSPLKSSCFSSENQDHCQIPGRRFFMTQERDVREWRDTQDKVERFSLSLVVFALHAFRACPARRAVSQSGNGIFHG